MHSSPTRRWQRTSQHARACRVRRCRLRRWRSDYSRSSPARRARTMSCPPVNAPRVWARSRLPWGSPARSRAPAHPALDFSDARVSRRGLASAASVGAPEQVHLLPGPGEVTVVWATSRRCPTSTRPSPTAASNANERKRSRRLPRAALSTTAYTAQICLGESMNVDPVMGEERHPVRVEDLVQLATPPAGPPRPPANYRVVTDPSQVIPAGWFHHPP